MGISRTTLVIPISLFTKDLRITGLYLLAFPCSSSQGERIKNP